MRLLRWEFKALARLVSHSIPVPMAVIVVGISLIGCAMRRSVYIPSEGGRVSYEVARAQPSLGRCMAFLRKVGDPTRRASLEQVCEPLFFARAVAAAERAAWVGTKHWAGNEVEESRRAEAGAYKDYLDLFAPGYRSAEIRRRMSSSSVVKPSSYYFDGIRPASADPDREPLKWRMLAHPRIPHGSAIPSGPSALQFVNATDKMLLVVVTSGSSAGSFFVDPSSGQEHSIPNGVYRVYIVYSDEPEALYQGDDISLSDERVKIKLTRETGSAYFPGFVYGTRRVE